MSDPQIKLCDYEFRNKSIVISWHYLGYPNDEYKWYAGSNGVALRSKNLAGFLYQLLMYIRINGIRIEFNDSQ